MKRMNDAPQGLRMFHALFSALLLGVLVLSGCGQSEGKEGNLEEAEVENLYNIGEPIDDSTYAAIVISEYGTDTLTTEFFEQQVQQVMQQFPQLGGDEEQQELLRSRIVQDFVMRHVVGKEAERAGFVVDTALVSQQIVELRGRFPDPAAFDAMMAQQGISEDSLRGILTAQRRMEMLQEQFIEEAGEPSAEEVAAFRTEQAEEIRAQHILFLTRGLDEAQMDSTRAAAQVVLDSVKAGADFEEMARRYSADGSAQQGGDLGFFPRGAMVPPFEEAAYALADTGDVTPELVETQFGYHIIRLADRRTAELMDSTQAVSAVRQRMQGEVLEDRFNELRAKATVRINPVVVDADINEEMDE